MHKKILDKIEELESKIESFKDLEAKVDLLQNRVSEQDSQIIRASKQRELIAKAASEKDISDTVSDFLAESDINITSKNKAKTLVAINAAEAVEKYGFRKFNPPHDGTSIKSPIVSLREFAEHPEKYIHKSSKGVFSFPLKLNNSNVEDLFTNYNNIRALCEYPRSSFRALEKSIEGYSEDNFVVSNILFSALTLARANGDFSNNNLSMDPFDFLENYDGIVAYIKDSKLNKTQKRKTLEALALSKAVYVAGFDIVSSTRIMSTEDLISYVEPDESEYVLVKKVGQNEGHRIYDDIKARLISDMDGFKDYDLDNLLPIRSVENFRKLASQRTTEIIALDASRNGLTANLNKDLSEYTPAEAILMSCYFARNIITSYKNLEDSIKDLLKGISPEGIEGKCTDYTGLALHYLREFLVPLNPERFNHWEFGYEVDSIGKGFDHCYMKAVHQKPDGTYNVFFIDPTSLSSLKIKDLKTPKNIVDYASTESHPVQIIRDAEDLLYDELKA